MMRRIAAHLLWHRGALIRRPVVTLDASGAVVRIERFDADPAGRDRLAATRFCAGMLIPDFPADYRPVFAAWCASGRPLPELLAETVPARPGCLVAVSGFDYATLQPTPQSRIEVL